MKKTPQWACKANIVSFPCLQVERVGMPGELLVGGDYERNDGTGGRALLPLEQGL